MFLHGIFGGSYHEPELIGTIEVSLVKRTELMMQPSRPT